MIGARNGNSKLDNKIVRQIKEMLRKGATQVAIADKFGISQANVSDIKRGRIWSHVE
jgi:predicted XRE-type DNA-binding protein